MAEEQRINAAYRLHIILSAAHAQSPQAEQFRVWANVFNVDGLSGRQQKQAVAVGITLMFRQLDHLVDQLRALNHPENSYRPLVSAMEQSISYEWLAQPWQQFRERLEKALYPLQIFSSVLPDEENLIDPKEFEAIRDELDKLEQSLSDKDISQTVRDFVKRQIDTIRTAMWEYQFRGAQVFQDAILQTVRDFANTDIAEKHKEDPPVQKLRHIWDKVMKVMDITVKVQGALTSGYKIYQLAESVGLHHLVK